MTKYKRTEGGKTREAIENHPLTVEVWDESQGEKGYEHNGMWATLARGYCADNNDGQHSLHEWNWTDLKRALADVRACSCPECEQMRAHEEFDDEPAQFGDEVITAEVTREWHAEEQAKLGREEQAEIDAQNAAADEAMKPLGRDDPPPPYTRAAGDGFELVVDGRAVERGLSYRDAQLALAVELEGRRVVDEDTFPRCVTCKTAPVARIDRDRCDGCHVEGLGSDADQVRRLAGKVGGAS